MNDEHIGQFILILIFCVGIAFLGGVLLGDYNTNQREKEAVSLGFAHYNSTNGIWEWNKKD